MTHRHGVRWALIGLGVLCVVMLATLIIAPSYAVRYLLQDYLQAHDIRARIGNVDANIFTGQISLDHARAQGPGGDTLVIGHLALNIDYASLLAQRIALDRLVLSDVRLPVRRTTQHGPRVLGIPLGSGSPSRSPEGGWGFRIAKTRLANIKLRYRAPREGGRRQLDQSVTVTGARAGDFATWRTGQSTPLMLDLVVGRGRLRLDGKITPRADKRGAHFKLEAAHFPMTALAPLARLAGWRHLGGTLKADQQVDVLYSQQQGLGLTVDGQSDWRNVRATTRNGIDLDGQRLSWHGNADIRLWRSGKRPGTAKARGRLTLASIRARRSNQFDFSQAGARWQGTAQARLADDAIQITTHGKLSTLQTRLHSPGSMTLSNARASLSGELDLTLDPDRLTIDSRGRFNARSMSLSVPKSMGLDSATLRWNGQTQTVLAGDGARIRSDGALDGSGLAFNVPETAHVSAKHIDWRGQTKMHSAALFSRRFKGHLIARAPVLNVPGLPARLTADRFIFDGRYAEQPIADGARLRLAVSGEAHGKNFAAVDTAIHAPWVDAMQVGATGIAIDGLQSIRLKKLRTSGLRLLGDTDTNSAVLQAVSMNANRLSLTDLAHYSLHKLTIDDAIIHTRRDSSGMGVISEYMKSLAGRSASSASSKSGHGKASSASTYAIDHLKLTGPAAAFVDTTKTPAVRLSGHDLEFTLDDLDTARPTHSATYDLSLDLGAYGHFASRGRIAPLAPDGPNMDLDAWLRSLALDSLSGYLNAAMSRVIARGAADGTLNLTARNGDLDGQVDMTIANLIIANNASKTTEIALGISMETALGLIRGPDDLIHFKTAVLGDVTTPYFSINNLIREAVLAGLRNALFSTYSPVGLLITAKNAILNLFRSVEDYPVIFRPAMHYVQPDYRRYMVLVAQAMRKHPAWTLHIRGRAVPADAAKLNIEGLSPTAQRTRLEHLARQRQSAIKDYLSARSVSPDRIVAGDPRVVDDRKARPAVELSLDKS